MITVPFLRRRREHAVCSIDVEQTGASLHAHVELEGAPALGPGDRMRVHGEPIQVSFGEHRVFHREVTIQRAGWVERQWVRLASRLSLTDLYEVSFSQGSLA